MDSRILIEEAKKARERAYAPYSHFCVGAALLTKSGKVYHGCNIENSSFTPTICAERTAFFKAVYDGERDFEKIAVIGGPEGTDGSDQCAPCGVCRQVMKEFCGPDFIVVMMDPEEEYTEVTLQELLPYGFSL